MPTEPDPVEWVRRSWAEAGQAEPDMFATMAAMLRAHQMLVAAIEAEVKPFGFGLTGFLLLTTLLMSRDVTRPLGQLSKHLMTHPTTVTLLVDQMEKQGLVKRSPHPSDRRIVLASLTTSGKRLAVRASKAVATVNYGLGDIGREDARHLTETLRLMRQSLGDTV